MTTYYTNRVARVFSIAIKDSFNCTTRFSGKTLEEFLDKLCEHMDHHFDSSMDPSDYIHIEDMDELRDLLYEDINRDIERYNDQINEYSNDEPITYQYISYLYIPGEYMHSMRKVTK